MSESLFSIRSTNPSSSPCWNKVIESKRTDAVLITGFVVLLIIAIAASGGAFNAMGTTNATRLSYGMYAGAALFLIAEIVKLVVNQCSKKTNDPLSQEEVKSLKEQAKLHAKNHAHVSLSDRNSIPNPNGPGTIFLDPTSAQTQKARESLFNYLVTIIDKADFQQNPVGYMVTWREQRGYTQEFRYLEDTARPFFITAIGKIRLLPNTAK